MPQDVITSPAAKLPYEKVALNLGPDVANFAGNFKNPSTNSQNQANQIYNSFQQFTNSYPGIGPSMYQMFSRQINSPSVQQRYQAAQTYNAATGATKSGGGVPSASSLWVTPSGAVVTFGGQLVSAPPPTTTAPPKKSNWGVIITDMSPILEIGMQILWLALAAWFVHRAYVANKKAEPFSLRAYVRSHDFNKGLDDMFIAGGFVGGFVLIVLLVHKLLTCGLICWS
jgi:hypothetical protein